ncbi:hypothetical protein D1O33_26540 (plasmid) [Rhodococcus rhodochrous]|uniref:YybH family protein n=1 Tax=Rhodococcus rhodochrous TaxID=1829 RepID=UPI00132F1035|nr:nuclear transport factor 2 family protein [Rhodococcus rhodochrous]QHG85549.1 hypothetical protein D1O33_26540 [Rhodococcus rhodochrous]
MADVELHPVDFDEPIGLFGTDPEDVAAIAAMEKECAAEYNRGFLTRPDIIVDKFYVNGGDHEDVSFIDILSPGHYFGPDVRAWFNFISPQFEAKFDLRNMRIFAKNGVGFVYMNQFYEGQLQDGRPLFWKMRQTDAVEKIDGEWKILHTHLSFSADPKDLDPYKWSIDLELAPRPQPWTVEKPYA